MKRNIALLLSLVVIILAFTGCTTQEAPPPAGTPAETPAPAPSGEKMFLNIGTGGTAGTYFPLGGAFAEIWNANVPNVNVTSQSTGAAVANINLLYDKKMEVAIVQNDIAWYAHNGKAMFEAQKYDDLRGLAILYNEPIQMITTDMSVNSLADLKGKVVSIGAIGSGNEANARQIIAAAGLDFDKDIDARFLPYSETVDGMKDNQIDVAIFTTGMPNSGITELGLTKEVKVVPIDTAVADKLMEEFAFFTKLVMPANTYKNQPTDVDTITVKSMLVVEASMTDELAYELTKQIYENHDRVVAAHAVGQFITPENSQDGMPIPLHPGAEKYFKEIGIIK